MSNQDFNAVEQRMQKALTLAEEEIRKLKEKMESFRQGGALYTELPPDLMEVKDTMRQLRNLELFRERILRECPWLDPSRRVTPKPAKVPLC